MNAINKLRECSNAENPVFAISEDLTSEKWIPLVKQLVEGNVWYELGKELSKETLDTISFSERVEKLTGFII